MSNSPQERFVKAIMEHSHGARFLFYPDDYRMGAKRQKVREAADLVWLCRDTAILLYMRSSKKDSAEEADEHNFGNANRWLRHWQQGEVMKGHNEFQEFSVPSGDIENLVVLSVVDVAGGSHAWAERIEEDWPSGVFVRASLPEAVLQQLGESGGSAADLAEFLHGMAVAFSDGSLTEDVALPALRTQQTIKLSTVRDAPVRTDRDDALDARVGLVLMQYLRHLPKSAVRFSMPDVEIPLPEVFNDLDWGMSAQLVAAIADTVRIVRDGSQRYAITEIAVDPYIFIVVATVVGFSQQAVEIAMPFVTECMRGRPDYPPTTLIYNVVRSSPGITGPHVMYKPQTGQTVAATALRKIPVAS